MISKCFPLRLLIATIEHRKLRVAVAGAVAAEASSFVCRWSRHINMHTAARKRVRWFTDRKCSLVSP
jgi:hypothetical protein